MPGNDAEQIRIDEDARRIRHWRRWGPYLAERQWGTVREDYSPDGECWNYLPHDHARSRAYRWGEDGLLGICDRECRLCFALALWNGNDPILKERLFGLSGPEGNHGEDVKELYYYLDATPTSAYLSALYKYPQAEFPYAQLVEENRRRGRGDREFEIEDTGVFEDGRYFDVHVEYAKAAPDDVLIRITVTNHGPEPATLHVLPTVWLRNTWAWGRHGDGYDPKGTIERAGAAAVRIDHPTLGCFRLDCEGRPELLFTGNETNTERLFDMPNKSMYTKDAFHRRVVHRDSGAVNPAEGGTKAAGWYVLDLPAGGVRTVKLRLAPEEKRGQPGEFPLSEEQKKGNSPVWPRFSSGEPFSGFDEVFTERIGEADRYHLAARTAPMTADERRVARQADASMVWSRQFYHYIVEHWLDGDPPGPEPPPAERRSGRNRGWDHLWAHDVIAMPDGWEYPWFAAWDLAFQCVAMARFDPEFAKRQLLLLCREWYMHPNGQLPAYEFAFGDVNPPVHAWAMWRVYQLAAESGHGFDRVFLEQAFTKCLINFTWWVNREDLEGDNLFTGGFLGLDNVGVFDRSQPLPGGGQLVQADATAWMAFYCTTMIAMGLELAREEPPYADLALKFFEHFVAIAKAANSLGGSGLWSDEDGFYYDQIQSASGARMLKIRSMVGLVPLFAAEALDDELLQQLPVFAERLNWFFANRPALARTISCHLDAHGQYRLLAIPSLDRLTRVLGYMLDEREFLSPYGIRSLSRFHHEHPYMLQLDGHTYEVHYTPGESDSGLFGGNSNWRGPVWLPVNYLLIEALKRYHHFYGDSLRVECPTGSGATMNLAEVAAELERRLARLFLPDAQGRRPCHGGSPRYAEEPAFSDLVLFYEYFHGDTGRGLGASHQAGWTALAANVIERVASVRAGG